MPVSHLWQNAVFLSLLTCHLTIQACALEGRKFSILGTFQIIKNRQNNLFERPFDDPLIIPTLMSLLVSPSSLTFPLGKLLQTAFPSS